MTLKETEIDLSEILSVIWEKKYLILFISLIGFSYASYYLNKAVRLYEVSIVLKPVNDHDGGKSSIGGLGGLASLAGISLSSGGSSDFITYTALLTSETAARSLFNEPLLVQNIFSQEWDPLSNDFIEPVSKKITSKYKRKLKKLLTGEIRMEYIKPDAKRISDHLASILDIATDVHTGFLIVKIKSAKPRLDAKLLLALTKHTDQIMKDKFLQMGNDAIDFYKLKIGKARSSEHREALARMITNEEKKLMLATRGGPFVAERLMGPSISARPIYPKNGLVLAMGLIIGTIVGIILVMIMAAIRSNSIKRSEH